LAATASSKRLSRTVLKSYFFYLQFEDLEDFAQAIKE